MKEDTIKGAQKILQDYTKKVLLDMPVWMKCNYLANLIGQIPEENWDEIDWDYVNKVLKDTNLDIDFNIFGEINSIEEFIDVRERAVLASVPEFDEPYLQKNCKICKEDFTLSLKEVMFFQKKNLHIPGKCYCCRKGIVKQPKIQAKTSVETEEPVKTAMQLALEKANIC